jgi:acetoin utilization deacetylase AcuC-like enzyme
MFLAHPSSLEHDTRGHPEQAARITVIERELAERGWFGFERVTSPAVERATLTAVHREEYVRAIERFAAAGGGRLDLDTLVSSGSWGAALHAAGGAVRMVDLLLRGEASCGFSAHRPPGHHALPSRGMGFCLFNNVAVAARYAIGSRACERVMVFDWDVHHGNGTNDIFHSSNQVLFVSIHQSPLYPGTGPAGDVGSGDGEGYTINLPVPPGSGDAVFVSLVRQVVVPLALQFKPQLLLLSAGYDAHRGDPLANCEVSEDGFAAMTALVREACTSLGAPIGAVLEGGYALGPLSRSVAATLEELGGGSAPPENPQSTPIAREARARVARWWPSLARL